MRLLAAFVEAAGLRRFAMLAALSRALGPVLSTGSGSAAAFQHLCLLHQALHAPQYKLLATAAIDNAAASKTGADIAADSKLLLHPGLMPGMRSVHRPPECRPPLLGLEKY